MKLRGKFITFEGGEGVGKTTNLTFLKDYLIQHHIPVVVSREPGGTQVAEQLRSLLLTKHKETITEQAELLLMFAARSQHIRHVIEPALAKGSWVLCDRFTDATYAYQGAGRNLGASAIQWLEHFVQQGLTPDLTILLDAPAETGLKRAKQRGVLDRIEDETLSFFGRVRRGYLLQAELEPARIKIVKADQPLVDVQNDIIGLIKHFFVNEH
ncbi:MAG: dTMP kinase [Methylicorpusculum sp.]|uniref:dTMP kinase n=1 Tax=Methylicorpusculum sp. TaxID=2713644 RepID=UPI00271C7A8E|nr:dTMP kinase [Methylicorpusculum sp.]MDO8941382.1 dTMP kinase [Methylicorpusculum sp.]MDP2203027.1 dTMP kinase [Methylicorpusculum sp.]